MLYSEPSARPVIPSSSRREVINGWNFIITAEGLYWIATEDGLYYAQSGRSTDGSTFDGHVERIHPSWRPGFRLGLGGNMPYDDWVTSLDWTYYSSKKKNENRGSLLLLWTEPDVFASSAKAQWKLNYDILDFIIGRPFWAGYRFSIFPFFGVRGAWLDQDFHIQSLSGSSTTNVHLENDFAGAGIRGGADIRYMLAGNWCFFGLFSGSLVYGHFHLGMKQANLHSRDGQDQGLPSVQLAGGVRWDKFFREGAVHLALYAAWEQNYWFNFNKMDHFQGTLHTAILLRNNGSLSLQGGTFGLQFFF